MSNKEALKQTLGSAQAKIHEGAPISAAISMNPRLILIGILGFVARLQVSLGPVMWVLFSNSSLKREVPHFLGFINSSFSLGTVHIPMELSTLGKCNDVPDFDGVFAAIGLLMVLKFVLKQKDNRWKR